MSNSYWWVGKLTVVLLLLGVVAGVFTGAVGAADAELDTRDGPLTETNNSSAYTATSSGDDIGVQTTGSDDSSGDGTQVAITTVPEARSFGSDEMMEIFVSASDADNDFALVPGENLTVTVERPDGSVESFAVVTDQDGRAQVNYDLSATNRGDGEYTVTVSQDDGTESATVTPTVGPIVEPAHRTYEPILINKTTNVDFFVRNGEFGVPDQTVNVTVRNPAGTVTQQYQTTTDADGFANVSLTPGQTGRYEITVAVPESGLSTTASYRSRKIIFYSSPFGLQGGLFSEETSFGGYIEDTDGLVRTTDLVVEFRNQSDAVVVNKTTTTGPNGFFAVEYTYTGSSDYLSADVRTADGTSITDEYVDVDVPTDDSAGTEPGVELGVTANSGDVPPGESATFNISAQDGGSAIANEDIDITARLGDDGAVLRSTTVTTDADGTASVSVPVPTGIDGVDIEGEATLTYNGSVVEAPFGADVKKYDIDVDPDGAFYTAGLNVSVRAEYIANETGAGGIPAQYTALLSGNTIGSYGTGQLVTDGTGHVNETVVIPRSIRPYDATPSANRYEDFSGYRVIEVDLPGMITIYAPKQNEFGNPVAAPGDTLSINFTTPDGTFASGLAYAEFPYGDSWQGGSTATAISNGANATLTVPEYAGDDDFVPVRVWAADSSGLFYTAETYIEVNDSSTSDDTTLDVSLSSSADIVTVGTNVTLTATATEPVEEYQWDVEGDGVIDETTTYNNVTGEAPAAGDYTARVIAVGTDGDTASATTNVTVVNDTSGVETNVDPSDLPGSGTETDPYIVTNASELQAMEDAMDAHYELGSDIDAVETEVWNNGSGFDPVVGFGGTFDGNRHTISGLYIRRPTASNVGLFGAQSGGVISNVVLVESNITGSTEVGSLVGYGTGGTIRNVSASGFVNGTDAIGGLVGHSDGTVRNVSLTEMSVSGRDSVGGVAGKSDGTVARSAATAVAVTGRSEVGGSVGENEGTVDRGYVTGSVNGSSDVGGLVGGNGGPVVRAFTNVSVTGTSNGIGGVVGDNYDGNITMADANGAVTGTDYVGGLVGDNRRTIRNVSANAVVTGDRYVGGLAGLNNGVVAHAASKGSVTGADDVGGLAGDNLDTVANVSAFSAVTGENFVGGLLGGNDGTLRDGYTAGPVNATGVEIGGAVGDNGGTIIDAYWDESATGQATSSGNGTGLTTSQMTGEAARTNMSGLPFGTVWETQPDDYPALIALLDSDGDSGGQTQVDVDPSDLPGSGTATDPYVITNTSELQAIEDDLDAHYQLGSDIDAAATALWNNQTGFDPIGNTTVGFTGTFDGAGHNITGLTVDRPSAFDVGVFGVVKNGGVVANIALRDANVSGERRVGLLAGGVNLDGTVRSSTATGNVSGNTYVGGLAGSVNGGRLNTTGARASVGGVDGVGGLSGRIAGSGTVVRSEANSTVSGETEVGGFVGTMSSRMASVDEASAWGTVEGVTDVGGFAGRVSASSITRSAAAGTVSGKNSVGGFAGTVTNGPNGYDGDIENSFTLAAVEGASNGQDIAGFAGTLRNGSVARSYATGSVTGPSGQVGGLTANSTDSAVIDAYWDESATGQTSSADSGTGLTTSQMTGEAARTNMSGLAFGTVWEAQPDDYPVLVAFEGDSASGGGDSGGQTQVDVDPADLDGSGTETDPYVITNASELQAMEDDLDAHYELGNDIDADDTALWNNESGFTPVGTSTSPFVGSLDGTNHTISGLTIDRPSERYVGLFGVVGSESSSIQHVPLRNITVSGESWVGGLVGEVTNGTVTAVSVTGSVNGSVDSARNVGGLVGWNDGTIDGALVSVSVTGAITQDEVTGEYSVGGVAGRNRGTIRNALATGQVRADITQYVGGLVGSSEGIVSNSYATSSVAGSEDVGGLVGQNRGTVYESFATGEVTGGSAVGGLVGSNNEAGIETGTIVDSYWDESTTGLATSAGNGTGLITSQMTGEAARTNMSGLAFGTVWETQADDYPVLVAFSADSGTEEITRLNPDGEVFQTGRVVSAPEQFEPGQAVNVTMRVEAQTDSAGDNIVYGAIGSGDGTLYGLNQMSSLGTGNVTVSTTLPSNATGDIYWTWVPATSESEARDKANVSLQEKDGENVTSITGFQNDGRIAYSLGRIDDGDDDGTDQNTPVFEVTGLTLPPSTGAGAPFTYTAEITNVGPVRGTQQVTASVGGQQVAVRNVTLNESASRTLAFRAQVDSAGTYEATVATDNETVGDPIEVTGQQFVVGHSTGDPHITTFDGAAYDFMAAGDYVLAREPQGEMLVVARQKPVSGSVSVNNMTGAIINGTSVVIDAEASSPVSVDGQSITLAVGENRTVAGGDAEIIRHGSAYSLYVAGADGVVGPSDEHLTADVVGDRVDISLYLHENRTRAVEGLFGTINGTAADDIAFENGTALDRPLNPDQLYDGFRADWRVSSEASPFATDYYRSTFPEQIVTIADLAESDRTKAEEILADTCLEPGTPQYRDALLDVALTADSSYIASACRASDDDISDADGGSATTSIQPAEQTLTPGETVTVNVTIDDVTNVYAASGLLSYNSSVLRAVDITRGDFLSQDGAETQLLVQSTNNTTGTVDFGITRANISTGQYGAGTVVQVEFVVADTAPAGAESQLALDSATLSDPSGNPISVTRRNASATVSDGLQLNASLASPVSYAGSPLQVRADGTGANVTQFAVNVTRIGGVSATVPCAGGPACSEFVSVTPEQSSWNGSSYEPVDVNVTADTDTGETTTKTLSTTIRTAGDASGDGTVDIKDAAALGQSWRSTAGEADYAPEADLNQDGRVNIFDAVLLGNNWQDEATSPDTSPTASFVTENGQLTAKAVSNATIAGTTNLPPESTVEVRVSSDSSNPFVTAPSATVGGNGQFAVTIDLSDQTDGAEFTATVRYNSTELVSRTGTVVSA